ncbi:MAG: 16S rRNA methyltransferase [Peptococcaceae bacterium BICA1-7]|nr:MAG: 16S rRNA methyltransferase [Peptococcaceae bacterium BICA1-7]HBV99542.1 16S rRNA (cytosine(967)-C(5))-methyltransferase RsmB [Desulfotomaculum sp.]
MVLKEVDTGDAYANLALSSALEKFKPGALDRAFATEAVYGTLRALNTLDWILNKHIRQPLEKQTSWIRNILRLGVYQIMYMDRVPPSAAVNEAANQARRFGHPGAVSFVNGVLRSVLRGRGEIRFPSLEEDPIAHIALRYSHPEWLVKRWLDDLGAGETIELCEANNRPAPVTVRTNTLKNTRDRLMELLKEEGQEVRETAYAPEGLVIGIAGLRGFAPFEKGLFQVQDESSMLVGHALSPAPGALVLDAASAPGGKATHLAQLMGDRGSVVAFDIHPHKIRLIEDNCRRLGITCVSPVVADARELPRDYAGRADFALLDAPCTGTGVIRRRPDSRWKKTPEMIPGILGLQREMLESIARCIKPGGVLVYSTCSVLEEENLGQVNNFLKTSGQFGLESLAGLLPGSLDGEESLDKGYIQLYPHRHGTDGFFMARMRRVT